MGYGLTFYLKKWFRRENSALDHKAFIHSKYTTGKYKTARSIVSWRGTVLKRWIQRDFVHISFKESTWSKINTRGRMN